MTRTNRNYVLSWFATFLLVLGIVFHFARSYRCYLGLTFLAAGCNTPDTAGHPHLDAVASVKLGELAHMESESTPVVFNGRVLVVSTLRWGPGSSPPRLRIYDFETRALFADFVAPQDLAYHCAFVENGTLYIFGVTGNIPGQALISGHGNSIIRIATTDLVSWTDPVIVYTFAQDVAGYNLSVAAEPNGYVLAYDYGGPGEAPTWKQRFLHSTDLAAWTETPGEGYMCTWWTAGATIRYHNGWYYLIYHVYAGNQFATRVAKSQNLRAWTDSKLYLIAPTEIFEGINASDVDLVELNGQVYISYMTGDQKTWSGVALATINGSTEQQLLESLF